MARWTKASVYARALLAHAVADSLKRKCACCGEAKQLRKVSDCEYVLECAVCDAERGSDEKGTS